MKRTSPKVLCVNTCISKILDPEKFTNEQLRKAFSNPFFGKTELDLNHDEDL